MKINGIEIECKEFAYDGCHKIYLIESDAQRKEAIRIGYEIKPIETIKETWENSCHLRFINTWNLKTAVVKQGKPAKFTFKDRQS